jgi:hypothetical protein
MWGDDQDRPDPPAFYTFSKRTARKEHTCNACEGTIPVGETYTRIAWKDEEGFKFVTLHGVGAQHALECAVTMRRDAEEERRLYEKTEGKW